MIDRPDTPRAKNYNHRYNIFWSTKKVFDRKRPRIISDTTGADTHDHVNVFEAIRRLINEQIDTKQQIYPKARESPEVRQSNSDKSASSEEKTNNFDNKKLKFLFKLYDQRRAAGIKPAMNYKYKSNLDIFENDSNHPCKEIESKDPQYSILVNGKNIDESDDSSDEK
jgi:hypothetical protein